MFKIWKSSLKFSIIYLGDNMKFKARPEKSNILLMSSIILLLLVTCIFWLILRKYVYCLVYFILTLFIAYTYFFTFYYIKENRFVARLGLIKISIKYDEIRKVESLKDKVKVHLKYFCITLYPNNQDIFVAKLNSKLTNKNSYNIMNK